MMTLKRLSSTLCSAVSSSASKPFHEIPGPRLYPVVGNLFQYVLGPFDRSKYHEALSQLYRKYGPVVKEDIGGRTVVHVFEPEDIKTVRLTGDL